MTNLAGCYKSFALCQEYNAAQQFLFLLQTLGAQHSSSEVCWCHLNQDIEMQLKLQEDAVDLLSSIAHVFCTILPTIFCYALARLVTQAWSRTAYTKSWLRFLLEFNIIVVPSILCINLLNHLVEWFCLAGILWLLLAMWRGKFYQHVQQRIFYLGRRPQLMTLARSIVFLHTCVCILAIDFASFPTEFRKSRRFGATLMDVGIGSFVLIMGLVSKRPRRYTDIWKMLRIVLPLTVLGVARTIITNAIDYHTDEHEYGVHLNAFTVLACVKLLGWLLSALVKNNYQLLPLGMIVLLLHETALQLGLSAFVMHENMLRVDFITSNREGLSSLAGFVGLYLVCMTLGNWLKMQDQLDIKQFMRKIGWLILACLLFWLCTIVCVFTVSVARVTCNLGYAMWMCALGLSMNTLCMLIFDLILNTIYPLKATSAEFALTANKQFSEQSAQLTENGSATLLSNDKVQQFAIPSFVEAINFNGLTLFLVCNLLTGFVNIFLAPKQRSTFEGLAILWCYLLLGLGLVFALYYFKIRMA